MENSIIVLTSRKCGKKHVSYNTVLGLEDEFSQCIGIAPMELCPFFYYVNRILKKMKLSGGIVDWINVRELKKYNGKIFFAVMGVFELESFKHTLKMYRDRLIIYIFDCWESQWERCESIFNEINPWMICFAYKKAKEHFSNIYERCYYLPQSMDIRYFHAYETKKTRLFIQMGRKTERLHNMVTNYLKIHNIEDCQENYIYERIKGNIIFPEVKELAEEISKSYFFLAAPQNIENEKLTGKISETTARFYEAMACKTLIIGIKPRDSFDELFPYKEAMIEVSEANFNSNIDALRNNIEQYNKIVENNYNYVMEHHRWKNRYRMLLELINPTITKL